MAMKTFFIDMLMLLLIYAINLEYLSQDHLQIILQSLKFIGLLMSSLSILAYGNINLNLNDIFLNLLTIIGFL